MKQLLLIGFTFLLAVSIVCSVYEHELQRGPYLQNQTETAVTVMWGTLETENAGKVEVRDIGSFMSTSTNDEGFTIHKARITDLLGNTTYYYRIWIDNKRLTDWIPFHTNKTKGTPFRFIITGDSGDDPSRQNHQLNIAEQMVTSLPDLWFHTGDMAVDFCNFNNFEKVTARHFAVYQTLNQSRPHYPCAGNHELDGEDRGVHFRNSFDFPDNGPKDYSHMPEVYYTTYGDLFCAALSSGGRKKDSSFGVILESLRKNGRQYNWLKSILKKQAQNYTWKMVMLHRHTYTSSKRYHVPFTMYAHDELLAITELCEDFGVDLILFGHVHSLQRSKPVYRGQVDFEKGVVHIDASGGGKVNTAGSGQYNDLWTDFVCGDRFGFFQGDVTYHGDESTLKLVCIDEFGEVINSDTGSSGVWSKTKKRIILSKTNANKE
jgi:hypothetical protein